MNDSTMNKDHAAMEALRAHPEIALAFNEMTETWTTPGTDPGLDAPRCEDPADAILLAAKVIEEAIAWDEECEEHPGETYDLETQTWSPAF